VPLRAIKYGSHYDDRVREAFGIDRATEMLRFEAESLHLDDSISLYLGDGDDIQLVFDGTDFSLVSSAGAVSLTTAGALSLLPAANLILKPTGYGYQLEGLPTRYRLEWIAGQRGKPGINADILDSTTGGAGTGETVRMVTDPDFEILGANAVSSDVSFYAEGGITVVTAGADGDGVFLLPHLDANQSGWAQVTWGSDQSTRWECRIRTGAAITNSIIWAGLKLTNTDVIATDADQAFFRYEDGVNTGKWQAVSSIANSDDAADSGVTVAINTEYHLVIDIQSDRTALFYINGVLVETSAALTTAKDFIPYIAIEADGAAEAKTLHVRSQAISRAFA